ncbi:MAG: hypothetical protein HQK70_15715 [Desulfamplus sp.]|nr:hypothetical protein [Desulfamplus sp.]
MSESIIKEVRRIRQQHAASMDYDLDRIFADLMARQNRHAAQGWKIISVPANWQSEDKISLKEIRFNLVKQEVNNTGA